nr:hypothetical protein [Tanacetum cinerariifolium]
MTTSASKGTRLKSKAKMTKPNIKKLPLKKTRAKGLAVLSEVALSEAEQIKLVTKRSKKDFHISHASSLGDAVDTQSKVPNEQVQKTFGTDEGTDEDDYDDESDNDDDGDNDDDSDNDDDDDENKTKYKEEEADEGTRTPSDNELTDEEKLDEEGTKDDEENDEVLRSCSEQQNVSQESGFEQEEEDAHVTLTSVSDAQKANEPVQSSYVSFDFTSKFLNLENPSLTNNEIASLMETSAPHATSIPKITSGFTTTTPPSPPVFILESELFELKQTNQFAEDVSLISGIDDKYLGSKMKEAVNVVIQLQTKKLKEEAQAENQDFLNQDEDPSARSERGMKRRKSGKDVESSKDSRSKETKSSSTSKYA